MRHVTRVLPRLAAYLWTSPNTLLGLLAGAAMLCTGARARVRHGTLECSGGTLGVRAMALPVPLRFCALTLGHVVLATSEAELALVRAHERVHVRQYERWGPLFLPAYAASSLWQGLRGRDPYRDNHFEREAYGVATGD